jgi:argininosuccinate lyase
VWNVADETEQGVNPMWGGRFGAAPAAVMERINPSIEFDKRLWREDISGSKAHAAMLVATGILAPEDGARIAAGLDRIAAEIAAGTFVFRRELEDIHMNVEARLAELIGEAAGRLHTARSRNDQVATDVRLWLRGTIDALDSDLAAFQAALIDQAERHAATVMPGFTHLQPAQPVTFGHHLLAYVEMAGRDRGRFADCRRRLDECPLGAAALAGTSFPIDRAMTAKALGFDRPTANSMDSVSDRDFVVEFLAASALAAIHLSRLAEEIVIWSGPQFGFVRVPDALSAGSSIMPQKRNPAAAELVRGKAGRIVGALVSVLAMLKGLALTYANDMQEDKEPLFDAADTLALCLAAMTATIAGLEARTAAMRRACEEGFLGATDLADWLVREAGLPFRRAHHAVGRIVRLAEEKGVPLEAVPLADARAIEPAITAAALAVTGIERSVAARTSLGGTAPEEVRRAAKAARERFLGGRT